MCKREVKLKPRAPEVRLRGAVAGLWRTKIAPPRQPLRTFKELADEYGLTVAELRSRAAHGCIPFPRPFIKSTYSGSYYRPSEVRAWWEATQNKESPHAGTQ